jgi:hypothetical protein
MLHWLFSRQPRILILLKALVYLKRRIRLPEEISLSKMLLRSRLFQLFQLSIDLLEAPALPKGWIHKWPEIESVVVRRVIIAVQCRGQRRHLVAVDGIVMEEAFNLLAVDRL